MEPLRLFGGLITIPMWGYYDVYTIAQIELMVADAPIVVYDHKNDGKRKANPMKVLEKMNEWEGRYGNGEKPILDLSNYK